MKDTQLIQEVKEALNKLNSSAGIMRMVNYKPIEKGAVTWLQGMVDALEEANRENERIKSFLRSSIEKNSQALSTTNDKWFAGVVFAYREVISLIDTIGTGFHKEDKTDTPSIDYKEKYEALVESIELLFETNGMRAASCTMMLEGELPSDQQSRVAGKYEAYSGISSELKMLIPHGEVSRDVPKRCD